MVTRTQSLLQGIALNLEGGNAPDWIQLIPAGPVIVGRDGRRWTLPDPNAVVTAFNAAAQKPHIDIEHSSQLKAPKGEPAPAVGWIDDMEVRDGAVWGRVDWTDEGRNAVAGRAYRYLSPAFRFNAATGEVSRIVSAGLTNNPNLDMAALNAAEEENDPMPDPAVLEALGLNSTASAADAVVAITRLKEARDTALNSAKMPDPEKFVPKADHDLALNRISNFEAAEATRQDEAIDAAVDGAIGAGEVAPASKDYHLAACRADGGLDRFRAAMGVTPKVVGTQSLDGKKPGEGEHVLSAEEMAVCSMFGTNPKAFAEAKKKEA